MSEPTKEAIEKAIEWLNLHATPHETHPGCWVSMIDDEGAVAVCIDGKPTELAVILATHAEHLAEKLVDAERRPDDPTPGAGGEMEILKVLAAIIGVILGLAFALFVVPLLLEIVFNPWRCKYPCHRGH